ncbi:anti-sigma factor antagonist [Pseudonocardia alni]|nr:anti-sigma factor antagonist [Pseudonocardia alni]
MRPAAVGPPRRTRHHPITDDEVEEDRMSGHHAVDVLVDRPGPGIVVLRIVGEVDAARVSGLRRTVIALVPEPALTRLCVDLTAVGYLDSHGVDLLVRTHRLARAHGIDMRVVVSGNRALERLVVVSGVERVLHLADDVTQAIAPDTEPAAHDRAPTPTRPGRLATTGEERAHDRPPTGTS